MPPAVFLSQLLMRTKGGTTDQTKLQDTPPSTIGISMFSLVCCPCLDIQVDYHFFLGDKGNVRTRCIAYKAKSEHGVRSTQSDLLNTINTTFLWVKRQDIALTSIATHSVVSTLNVKKRRQRLNQSSIGQLPGDSWICQNVRCTLVC